MLVNRLKSIGNFLDGLLAIGFGYGIYRWGRDVVAGANGITLAMFVLYVGLTLKTTRLAIRPLLAGAALFSQLWRLVNIGLILVSFYLLSREGNDD